MKEREEFFEAAKQGDVETVKAILGDKPELVNAKDEGGATALHHAAFGGHRAVVEALLEAGAEINATDGEFAATPTGWAIEYLRERGGFLAIELEDLAYAIERGNVEWAARLLQRFPKLREGANKRGRQFKDLAQQSGNAEMVKLFWSLEKSKS